MSALSAIVVVSHVVGADMSADGVFRIVAFRRTGSRLAALCLCTGRVACPAVICVRLRVNTGMRTDEKPLFLALIAAFAIIATFRVGTFMIARTAAVGVRLGVDAGQIA